MKFDEIMAFYNFNSDVFESLSTQLNRNLIVPFVGAGLSVPIYPSWSCTIKLLTTKLDQIQKNEINAILESTADNKYGIAVDKIIEYIPEIYLKRELLSIFTDEKINDDDLRKMTVRILPFLFPDAPVITTNYDRVLERVYDLDHITHFSYTLKPDSDIITLSMQIGSHCLTKIHGDIGKELLNYDEIILSDASYNRAYAPGSPLVKHLSDFYIGRIMLFLGCSLENDRTFDVLKRIYKNDKTEHFAIMPCKKEDILRKSKILADAGIRAIFYEDGKHESVEIILRELLRKKDSGKFDAYNQSYFDNRNSNQSRTNPYLYNSNALEYFGRKDELQKLDEFIKCPDSFRWWAISGPGGIGKSRLAYELENNLRALDWHIYELNQNFFKPISEIEKDIICNRKNLIVIDYGLSVMYEIKQLLHYLSNRYDNNIVRVIVIEREGKNLQDSILGKSLLEGEWDGTIESHIWDNQFLELKPLSKDVLSNIMIDYINWRKKTDSSIKTPDKYDLNNMIKVLRTIDNLRRPLYALFVADAWCENKQLNKLNYTKTLDWVIKKENQYCLNILYKCTGLMSGNRKVISAVERLRFFATVNGGFTIDDCQIPDIKKTYDELSVIIENGPRGVDLTEALTTSGIMESDVLLPIKPDILGEYYVYTKLKQKQMRKYLFIDGWETNSNILSFLIRLYMDFHEELEYKNEKSSSKQFFFDYAFEAAKNPDSSSNLKELILQFIKHASKPIATRALNVLDASKISMTDRILHHKP